MFLVLLVFVLGDLCSSQNRVLRRRKPVAELQEKINTNSDYDNSGEDFPQSVRSRPHPNSRHRSANRGRSVGRNRGLKGRNRQRSRGMQRIRPQIRRPNYDYYDYYYDEYYEYYEDTYYQDQSSTVQRIKKKENLTPTEVNEFPDKSKIDSGSIQVNKQDSPDYGGLIKKLWEEFLHEKTSPDKKQTTVEESYECSPREASYFEPDEVQCDKYYECNIKGEIKEHLCPDGFTFDVTLEKCDYPVKVNCSTRPQLQEPQPSTNCSRANGFFPWPANISCQNFWDCREGRAYKQTCPVGVIFDPLLNTCATPDQSTRQECKEGESNFLGFTCPQYTEESVLKFGNHDRLAHPDDCQQYFSCLRSGEPRLATCPRKKVFNNATGQCSEPKNVVGCENYWIEKLKDEEEYYYDY